MRWNIGGHAHSNTNLAVQEQVRQLGGQHGWLLQAAIVVISKINRFFIDIGQHLVRRAGHACLGVAHGCRRVAIHRAKVTLAIHQCVAYRPVLGQAHHSIVNSAIAVRMEVTHHRTNDGGTLAMLATSPQAIAVHGV